VIAVLAGWKAIGERVAQYYASFLIMSGLLIGVFSAVDGCCSTCSSSRP